ncbi:hypothetical protein [Muricoccus radiodurans]|uniref:hypothetical protein n=1 Tax=Muricoccus radiodurans TaxID=2231721 RepID=UPI003CE73EB8
MWALITALAALLPSTTQANLILPDEDEIVVEVSLIYERVRHSFSDVISARARGRADLPTPHGRLLVTVVCQNDGIHSHPDSRVPNGAPHLSIELQGNEFDIRRGAGAAEVTRIARRDDDSSPTSEDVSVAGRRLIAPTLSLTAIPSSMTFLIYLRDRTPLIFTITGFREHLPLVMEHC